MADDLAASYAAIGGKAPSANPKQSLFSRWKGGDFAGMAGQSQPQQVEDAPYVPVPMAGIIPRQPAFQQPMFQPAPFRPPAPQEPNNRMFAGYMAHGGQIFPGQTAIVGENGPEVAQAQPDGSTAIQPLNQDDQQSQTGSYNDRPESYSPNVPAAVPPVTPQEPSQADAFQAQPSYSAPAPTQPANRLFSSSGIGDQIAQNQADQEDVRDHKGPRDKSLLSRLKSGLFNGYKNWDGSGGLVGLGVATLGGGVGAAASPQLNAQMKLQSQQNRLFKDQAIAQQREKFANDANYKDAQTDLAVARPGIMQQNADTATYKAATKAKNDVEVLNFRKNSDKWKQEDRSKWLELQTKKAEARAEHDSTMEDIYQQRQDEIERHNGATEKQQSTNESGRTDRLATQQKTILERLQNGNEQEKKRERANIAKSYLKAHPKATPLQVNAFIDGIAQPQQ